MTGGALDSTPRRTRRSVARSAALGAAGLVLAACGLTSGPPPVTYVLGTPAPAADGVESLTGKPVIEVKPVLVPDYLDVADIMIRQADNVVAPSPTGRWGERLSVGVTRALTLGLARRLPQYMVSVLYTTDAA
ncbi:MAG: membrane integrity-associated transporter subunit PqiC, partial [Acetobacteraceae bacterium]|nr:membrane integrity-associated transporter subunit PqiC [Acetobacteraceae bacterium]